MRFIPLWKSKRRFGIIVVILLVSLFFWRYKLLNHQVGTEVEITLPEVAVVDLDPESMTAELVLSGHTKAARTVTLRAETAGKVAEITIPYGQKVEGDQPLVLLEKGDRPARLEEAKARLRQREVEYGASGKLAAKSFKSENALAAAKTEFEIAKAQLAKIEEEVNNLVFKAPFTGIFEQRFVEVGDFVNVGDKVATVVELDPIHVVCYVAEKDISVIKIGAEAKVFLPSFPANLSPITAKVFSVASVADPKTRTYKVELQATNPDLKILDGLTAQIKIDKGKVMAYQSSPAVLSLNDKGIIGIKIVKEGQVIFKPVTIIESNPQMFWFTGVEGKITLITVGGAFVKDGQKVKAVYQKVLK
jgi:multidrug efflux system membrane fusion protein